jgi:ferritin-like metal-binding protein YciE
MKWQNLKDLYVHELRDLYAAQTRLLGLWSRLGEAAATPELRAFCGAHAHDSGSRRARIVTVCEELGVVPDGVKCEAIAGLQRQADTIMEVDGAEAVREAGLIALGNHIEHYEMAAYGAARTHARLLGYEDQARLLQQSLHEAGTSDRNLTLLAERIYAQAAC